MTEHEQLAERFEQHRDHLRAVAYRMLGSLSEADDAVQEAWLRLGRVDPGGVENLGGWLTTTVARLCLDALRSRRSRREEPYAGHVPDPIVSPIGRREDDPERRVELADSVALALLVVLETLTPAERLAFVLHDLFAVSFDEIAPIVGRTPTAARQLASRARRRVQGSPVPDADPGRHRAVVDAFLAASSSGDFDGLLAILDPDVVLRSDGGPTGSSKELRGAEVVVRSALAFWRRPVADRVVRPALVNGAPGLVAWVGGEPLSVLAFTTRGGRIVEIDILADPARLRTLGLESLAAG